MDPFLPQQYMYERSLRGGSKSDISMPDYVGSRSASGHAASSATGPSYTHSKQSSVIGPADEEHYHPFADATKPSKTAQAARHQHQHHHHQTASNIGVPSTSRLGLDPGTTDNRMTRDTRSGSRSSIPSIVTEGPQPEPRDVSGSSAKSSIPADGGAGLGPVVMSRMRVSPGGNSNKRGKNELAVDVENKENETSPESADEDGDGVDNAKAKNIARMGGNMDPPLRTSRQRTRSSGSILGDLVEEFTNAPGNEVPLVSPKTPRRAASPAVEDQIHQDAGFEEFLDNDRLGQEASTAEMAETD